ncbi:DUF2339 domain-containing protein [Pseudozobellia sp. WGM2]|uniref:DUF2339 domain-containing protein n=1 Tax=Pseudozobellia sp. WGM2 TaxID=2787625 RepID=UPI001ADED737|nr:DUF2339 domain-containing protein [Pseudozobellia sp. WGM2]
MPNHQFRIEELNKKLELLLSKQESFAKELMVLYKEIEDLKAQNTNEAIEEKPSSISSKEIPKTLEPQTAKKVETESIFEQEEHQTQIESKTVKNRLSKQPGQKSNLEKFIGENLINKIGIVITVIGVAIGAKYSIENELISPLTRIILGNLTGLGLLGFAIKLKQKYENYSAVLTSGALAILYFITFAAYSFYGLYLQLVTFALMVLFTIFGVVASLNYNKQIIAHIGLVGAYAVPFLLSDGSGKASILFSYMTIINIGILVISIKKYWKPLFYAAFGFTWLIFASWLIFTFKTEEHFSLALLFTILFFIIFYATFLSNKLINTEKFLRSDIVLLLLNSFVFYALGYYLLNGHEIGKEYLGLFTLANAIVHFAVSIILFTKKLADRNLFHLVAGLVLVFVTIAIPVQLDGNWVTLLWVMIGALLFWFGRTKKVLFYEFLSYPLLFLAFISLNHDWGQGYAKGYLEASAITPVLNVYLLTSFLFLVSLAFINWVNTKFSGNILHGQNSKLSRIVDYAIPSLFLLILYSAFYLEIDYYWHRAYIESEIELLSKNNYDLINFGDIWSLNYSLGFVAALAFINMKKIKNRNLGICTLFVGLLACFAFLSGGLYILSELRESYLNGILAEHFEISFFNVTIRYVSIAFFALLLLAIKKIILQPFMKTDLKVPFELLMHTSILWVLSSELLNWMDIFGSNQIYKLGLSILWGLYSLILIGLGIWKRKKYLRYSAMGLFAITLLKLFFYDIASLNTISKTIVFVSLGILLLIISFLYNKYKNLIAEDKTESKPEKNELL